MPARRTGQRATLCCYLLFTAGRCFRHTSGISLPSKADLGPAGVTRMYARVHSTYWSLPAGSADTQLEGTHLQVQIVTRLVQPACTLVCSQDTAARQMAKQLLHALASAACMLEHQHRVHVGMTIYAACRWVVVLMLICCSCSVASLLHHACHGHRPPMHKPAHEEYGATPPVQLCKQFPRHACRLQRG